MRLLLDTHSLLWLLDESPLLPSKVIKCLQDAVEIHISTASLWEIAIKANTGKLKIEDNFFQTIHHGEHTLLPVSVEHIATFRHLPLHHRDPFDRMLIAQAQHEKLTLVSRDRHFSAYDVQLLPWS